MKEELQGNKTRYVAVSASRGERNLFRIVRATTFFPAQFSEAEEGRFLLWVPVLVAVGIASYFAIPFEPTSSLVIVLFGFGISASLFLAFGLKRSVLAVVLFFTIAGFALAKVRTELVCAPVLSGKGGFYEVEGQLRRLIPLPDAQRQLILANVTLKRGQKVIRLKRIRLSSRIRESSLKAGAFIRLKAVLRPPPDPVRPDGFDFARMAWFQQIGAVGYTVSRSEAVALRPIWEWRARLERLRQHIYDNIVNAAPGVGGEIAVALILGERKRLEPEVLEAIRTAGLAHMLAISGMHMVLVSGAIYWLIRALLATNEMLALRYDLRKFAAFAALIAAAAYYLISGMGIATLRAFVMTSIVLAAILLGRTALNLRSVAFAALFILIVMPESLLDVSFQMSFAAVVALIAVYEIFSAGERRLRVHSAIDWVFRKIGLGIISIFLTTLIAGIAVLPFAIYHFHHFSTYSLLGNILAMPILSFFVMPMGLLGVLLMPIGLHTLPLVLMSEGTEAILAIAKWVATLDNARVGTGEVGFDGLVVIVVGGLWLFLWHSRWRLLGLPIIALGIALAQWTEKPTLLIDREGTNVVLIDANNRMWASQPDQAGYSLREWSEAYAGTGENEAFKHIETGRVDVSSPWRCDEQGCTVQYLNFTVAYSLHPGALEEDCRRADILIANYPVQKNSAACSSVSRIIDIRDLNQSGSHAIYMRQGNFKIVNSAEVRGKRPWSSQQAR